ncbi:hypothetical protein ACFL5O_01690 [Myxococcota bacterium]
MTGGERLRFHSTLGAGSVQHRVKRPEADEAKGWSPYLLVELGARMNWEHLLLGLDLFTFVDRTNATNHQGKTVYSGLIVSGLGLRGGWSEWSPPLGAKLRFPD